MFTYYGRIVIVLFCLRDIGSNCSDVEVALINQMKIWHTKDNCLNGGQRCLYEVIRVCLELSFEFVTAAMTTKTFKLASQKRMKLPVQILPNS